MAAKATIDIQVDGKVVATLPIEAERVTFFAPRGQIGTHGFNDNTIPLIILDVQGGPVGQEFSVKSVSYDKEGELKRSGVDLEMSPTNAAEGLVVRKAVVANTEGGKPSVNPTVVDVPLKSERVEGEDPGLGDPLPEPKTEEEPEKVTATSSKSK